MPEYFWLSYPLSVHDPRPPAIPEPSIEAFMSVARGDEANVQILRIANHTGTHIDTPAHVIEGGATIHDFLPEELIFNAIAVIRIKKNDSQIVAPQDLLPFKSELAKAEMALFNFGFGEVRRTEPRRYSLQSPGFGCEAAEWLIGNCPSLRALGLDVPSFSVIAHIEETMKAHNIMLGQKGRKLIIIEEMNLEQDLQGLEEVRVNPWLVVGMDSSPCTIVGVRNTLKGKRR